MCRDGHYNLFVLSGNKGKEFRGYGFSIRSIDIGNQFIENKETNEINEQKDFFTQSIESNLLFLIDEMNKATFFHHSSL